MTTRASLSLQYRLNQGTAINICNYKSPNDMKIAQYSKRLIAIMEEEGKQLSEIPFEYSNKLFNLLFYAFNKGTRKKNDILLIKHYLINFPNLIKTIYQKKVFYDANELLNKIALFLKCQEIRKHTLICRLGEIGDKFYLIFQGSVGILLPREYKEKMTETEYINHLDLLYRHREYELILRTIASNNHIYRSLEIFEMRSKLENDIDLYYSLELKEIISVNDYINRITPKQPDCYENREGKVNSVMLWTYLCVTSISEGQTFGDIALSDVIKRRTASIISLENTYCGTLEIAVYKSCIKDAQDKIRKMNVNVLLSTSIFSGIGTETFERKHFNYFRNVKLARGERLFKQGALVEDIFFIKDGEITVTIKASFDFINKLHQAKCGNGNNNSSEESREVIAMIKNCPAFEKYYYDTNQVHPLFIIGNKEIIGLDEYLYEGRFYCEGKCTSEKGEIFAISLQFFKDIIKFERREEKIKEYVRMKDALVIERLIQIKENQLRKRYETMFTMPVKRSKMNIINIKPITMSNAKKIVFDKESKDKGTNSGVDDGIKAITEGSEANEKQNNNKRSYSMSISKDISPKQSRQHNGRNNRNSVNKIKRFIINLNQSVTTTTQINKENRSNTVKSFELYQRKMFNTIIKRAYSACGCKGNKREIGKGNVKSNVIDIMAFDNQLRQLEDKHLKRNRSEAKLPKIMRLIHTNTKPLIKLIRPPKPRTKIDKS